MDASVPVGLVTQLQLASATTQFLAGTCLPITVTTRGDGGVLVAPGPNAVLNLSALGVVTYAGDSCVPPATTSVPFPPNAGQLVVSVGSQRLDGGLRLGDGALTASLSTPSLAVQSDQLGLESRGVLHLNRTSTSGAPYICEQVPVEVSLKGAAGVDAVPSSAGAIVPLRVTGPLTVFQSDGGSDLDVCWTRDAGSRLVLDAAGRAQFRFLFEGPGTIRALAGGSWSDSSELTVSTLPVTVRITADAGVVSAGTCVAVLLEAAGPAGPAINGQTTDRFPFTLRADPGLSVSTVPGCVGSLNLAQPLVVNSIARTSLYVTGRLPFPDAGLTFGTLSLRASLGDAGSADASFEFVAQVTAAPVLRQPACTGASPLRLAARALDGGPAFAARPTTLSFLPFASMTGTCLNSPPLVWDAGVSSVELPVALFGPDGGSVKLLGDGLEPFDVTW